MRSPRQLRPERVPEQRQPLAPHRDEHLPAPLDGHGVPQGHELLADDRHHLPAGVPQLQRVPDPQHLPVDVEDPAAVLVLDPVVVPDGQQLLPHHVSHGRIVLTRSAVEATVDWIVGARLEPARQKPRRAQIRAWLTLRVLLWSSIPAMTSSRKITETETTMRR
jgi:hypothetical protein